MAHSPVLNITDKRLWRVVHAGHDPRFGRDRLIEFVDNYLKLRARRPDKLDATRIAWYSHRSGTGETDMIRAIFFVSFAVIAAFLTGIGSAVATPQMLAVAALENPQNLVCEDGICSVELSAICLQKNRRFPGTQSVYHPHDPGSIQLVIHDLYGNELRLIADDYVAIRSKRTFTAVTVRIDEDVLKNLGAMDVAVVVAEYTTLVPDPVPFDNYPHTADEIAHTAGPLRILASAWLAGDGEQTVVARLMNQMLNGLSDDEGGEDLWQSATGLSDTPSDPGAVHAKSVLDTCITRSTNDPPDSLRRCLELKHDSTMYHMNMDFWDAVKTGS